MFDSFEAHKTEQVKQSLKSENTDLSVIPGGLTSVLQPLDVCLNKPFKDRLRDVMAWITEKRNNGLAILAEVDDLDSRRSP